MGVLDALAGAATSIQFLNAHHRKLSDDLAALLAAIRVWHADEPVAVGESGTLYRFLQFASWKLALDKKFLLSGTLRWRPMVDDPSIVQLPQRELLKLDRGTSQWASAAVLLGDEERLPAPPFKLALTYEAIGHWADARARGATWVPRRDETIERQANAFVAKFKGEPESFEPAQAEDFCFAYCCCGMSAAEGERRWPSLRGHESDRIVEIQEAIMDARAGVRIASKDHRVIQAVAMWGALQGITPVFIHPYAVNKSWPQFWQFLDQYR